jgi:hypothetical protein
MGTDARSVTRPVATLTLMLRRQSEKVMYYDSETRLSRENVQ